MANSFDFDNRNADDPGSRKKVEAIAEQIAGSKNEQSDGG